MADNNFSEKGKILTQLMIETMNQELAEEQLAHEQLLMQINNLALVRQQEKNKAILHQINIIETEQKKEYFIKLLMTTIDEKKNLFLNKQLQSEEVNLLSSKDKEELLKYAVDQFSQKGVLILLDYFSNDMSIDKKREVFVTALLSKIPHPDESINKLLLYSGRFLHDFLEKSGISQASLREIFSSNIAQMAEDRISTMHTERRITVPRERRVQSS